MIQALRLTRHVCPSGRVESATCDPIRGEYSHNRQVYQ